jgi:Tfp pilus assembly protein PilF
MFFFFSALYQVIEHDPVNVKALYRRSQAYLKISELEKAEADIKTALTIDPNNRYEPCDKHFST